MPWVRIDEEFYHHPKVVQAGPLGIALQVSALCYCNKHLTDGFIPRSAARSLLDWQTVDEHDRVWSLARTSGHAGEDIAADWVIELLVGAGMWEPVPGGWKIHDYEDYQPTREQVEAEREQRRGAANARWAKNGSAPHTTRNADRMRDAMPVPVPDPETKPQSKSSLRASARENEHPQFDEFWTAYPRRIDRAAASRCFTRLVRAQVDPASLVTAARNYATYVDQQCTEAKFVLYGSTFLGPQRRWEDFVAGVPEERAGSTRPRNDTAERALRIAEEYEHAEQRSSQDPRALGRVLPASELA